MFSPPSARFATRKERAAFEGGDGLLIGRDLNTGKLLRYDGPTHLLTLAPTRAGKGVGTVIPNLLLAERSVLVIDPFDVTGMPASAYSPLGQLDAESLDLNEDATSLADLARQEEQTFQRLRDDLAGAGRWKKSTPFIALFGLVLALGLAIALPRFMAGNASACTVLGGECLRSSDSGQLACVFFVEWSEGLRARLSTGQGVKYGLDSVLSAENVL